MLQRLWELKSRYLKLLVYVSVVCINHHSFYFHLCSLYDLGTHTIFSSLICNYQEKHKHWQETINNFHKNEPQKLTIPRIYLFFAWESLKPINFIANLAIKTEHYENIYCKKKKTNPNLFVRWMGTLQKELQGPFTRKLAF